MRQSSDEEEEQQCQPTPSLDHAASRLVKKDLPTSTVSIIAVLNLVRQIGKESLPNLSSQKPWSMHRTSFSSRSHLLKQAVQIYSGAALPT